MSNNRFFYGEFWKLQFFFCLKTIMIKKHRELSGTDILYNWRASLKLLFFNLVHLKLSSIAWDINIKQRKISDSWLLPFIMDRSVILKIWKYLNVHNSWFSRKRDWSWKCAAWLETLFVWTSDKCLPNPHRIYGHESPVMWREKKNVISRGSSRMTYAGYLFAERHR